MSHKIGYFTERLNECLGFRVRASFDGKEQVGELAKIDDRFFVQQGSYGFLVEVDDITTVNVLFAGLLFISLTTKFSYDDVVKLN